MEGRTSKNSDGIPFAAVWTRHPHKVSTLGDGWCEVQRKGGKDIRDHHREYTSTVKQYADQKSKAKEHNFKVGDVVYIANMENGKLDSTFKDTHYVILRNTADNSFELVNTEDRSKIIRNVKHTPVVTDFDSSETPNITKHQPLEVSAEKDAGPEIHFNQIAPAVEILPKPDSATAPQWQVVTRSGMVIRKPPRYRDTWKKKKRSKTIMRYCPLYD